MKDQTKLYRNYRSILWYETNKLNKYIEKNGTEDNFRYKYLDMTFNDYCNYKKKLP